MGRHRTNVSAIAHGYRCPGWGEGYRCEWAIVVGDRVRRVRRDRGLTLVELCRVVEKPQGEGRWSPGYISRLERGWGSPPFYAYVAIADALDVHPGRLLGPDDAQEDVTEAELTLVRLIRLLRMPVPEAIARLIGRPPAAAAPAADVAYAPAAAPADHEAAGSVGPVGWDAGVAEAIRAYEIAHEDEPPPA